MDIRKIVAVVLIGSAGLVPQISWAASEEANAIVEKIVTRDVIEANFETVRPLILPALRNVFVAHNVKVSPENEQQLLDVFFRFMTNDFIESYGAGVAEVYDELFTPAELKDIVAFYETPVGAAFAAKQPQIILRTSEIGKQLGEQAGAKAFNHVSELLAKEGKSLFDKKGLLDRLRDR